MDNKTEVEDTRLRKDVPLFYRYMIKQKVQSKIIPVKTSIIQSGFYQTEAFKPYPFYRPISCICKPKLK